MIKKLLQRNNFILVCSVAAVCTLVFSGCKKEQSPAAAPVQQAKTVPPPGQAKAVQKPVSSVQVQPAPKSNLFDFSTKKDPFKAAVLVKAVPVQSSENAKNALKEALPIHSLDVNQFKLIGIITGVKENRAMVTDTGGKGYVLKVGMTIGKNNGKVVAITANGVDVVEQFKDENGRVSKENIKLTLPRKQ